MVAMEGRELLASGGTSQQAPQHPTMYKAASPPTTGNPPANTSSALRSRNPDLNTVSWEDLTEKIALG